MILRGLKDIVWAQSYYLRKINVIFYLVPSPFHLMTWFRCNFLVCNIHLKLYWFPAFLFLYPFRLSILDKIFSRQHTEIFFLFSQKTDTYISYKMSPLGTICMKWQILFSGKNVINLSSAELAQRVVKVFQENRSWHLKETICIKCQCLFSGKNKKKWLKMLSAEISTLHAKHLVTAKHWAGISAWLLLYFSL